LPDVDLVLSLSSASNTFMTLSKEDIIHQQILQAAQQLFQRHGYQKVTIVG